ncbi:hypothetical protein JVT61DRAFT_8920 [Boletus reticuloceps]|uniref:DUF6535 domain-containing protein n=1 Tax=Boletus reticuloceps TaxID=495285 RepID=A0A8I3A5K3_9AGAM|nr:hypothetical protein JVT61DRAFT_8920 [Boletus reticuloceps]
MKRNNHADTTNSPQTPSNDPTASDRVAPFWSQYVEEAEKYDEAFLEKDRIRMDGVLVFAGLFSAVTASFLISLRGTLQPNPSDTTNALLMMVVHSLDNSTFSGQTLEIPTWNGPTNSNVLAQALGYAALSANLLASFGAVLGKRWLCDYAASKIGSLQERGSRRQQKLDALEEWRFEAFMAALPGLIQMALLLFGIALSISLWEINETLGYVVMSMTGLGVSFYLFVTVASLLHPTCPFHTPLSSTIQEATAIVAKSVEELADYCAWRSVSIPQWQPEPVTSQANRTLTHLAVLFSLLITVFIIPIVITSTHPEKLIAALELVPVVAWPKYSNLSLLGEGPHNLFARSIPEIHSLKDRALPLGKALVALLCRMPSSVRFHGHIREETVEQLDKIIHKPMADWDFDIVFTLTIVKKLLRLKLDSEDHGPELSPTRDVSQSLLVWLLGLMETMLRSGPWHAKRFLPKASRLYLKLDLKRANLSPEQQVQYCRTFEIFFNFTLGYDVEEMNVSADPPAIRKQSDCLERILVKLKSVKPHRLSDVQGHLIVTLTVLSKLATTPSLREIIKDAAIDSWMLAAFKEAVGKADKNERSVWLFNWRLGIVRQAVWPWETGAEPPRMDSKSLLSYLLNREIPATSEQVVYTLRIMLSNEDEHLVLASDPHFVDYILVAADPSGEDSIRDVGLKLLTATCRSLLCAHDAKSLVALANDCDLAHFLHRAFLHQDPPTILKDLLRVNDKDFNEKLFGILAPALDDHFDPVLTKLRDEPNKIPEHDLRELEMALVLSDNEGRKEYLFKHLDDHIATMPRQSTMALPLTAIVGWLLRPNGPICSSGKKVDGKAFLRPKFQRLLFPAWGDPGALGDNPQTLRLLLNCTEKWLSTYGYFGTEASPQSPPAPTLERLQRAVDQLSSRTYELPVDIKRTLQGFSSEINRHGKDKVTVEQIRANQQVIP